MGHKFDVTLLTEASLNDLFLFAHVHISLFPNALSDSFDGFFQSAISLAQHSSITMADSRTRLYIGLSFVAGILLTLGFKDVYPDLERRFHRKSKIYRSVSRRFSRFSLGPAVQLKDNESGATKSKESQPIPEGLEACIGNTPLFRIKSLSDATGCEILAKAEFLNGAGNSPKDRVALNIIRQAEEEGLLTPFSGDKIYEGTVGSTGISLAAICRARGYLAHMYVNRRLAKPELRLISKAVACPMIKQRRSQICYLS
jgi:cysteine synthase A